MVLLSLLTAMITLAIPSPMRDLVIGGNAAAKALLESPEVLREAAPSLALVWFVLLVTGSLISVVLARTIVLGRGRAMDGGWQSLGWRGFRVVMKALAALFFIVLFALPSFFLVGLIANTAGAGANMILVVALMLWMVVVATVVTGAYYAAVLAESTDRPSGIVKGWDALKGKLMDLCGAILILWVVFLLVAGIIDPIITFGTGLFLGEGLARALYGA